MPNETQTQEKKLLEALKTGMGVTPSFAFIELGIYRLSARIYDLRKKGYNITTGLRRVTTRTGEKTDVAVYRLNQ